MYWHSNFQPITTCKHDHLPPSPPPHEAIECVKEMKCPEQLHVFVRELINVMMEKNDAHRLLASQLLRDLLKDGELTRDKFRDG